jgi:hypothetical protein
MRYRILSGLAIAAALWTQAPEASAQGGLVTSVDSSVITVDVLPLAAEVRLNGVYIGTARDLLARPVFVLPGDHQLEFAAPGHITATIRVTGIPDWATRVTMALVPERR